MPSYRQAAWSTMHITQNKQQGHIPYIAPRQLGKSARATIGDDSSDLSNAVSRDTEVSTPVMSQAEW